MIYCKNCIHCEICDEDSQLPPQELYYCRFFKDKSKFIELPCPIGTTVYMITTSYDDWSGYDFKKIIQASFRLDMLRDFNKRFFLTREEAEKKLGELK